MSTSTHSEVLKHHFDNLEQQHSAERLGMWMFLATEVLFFSGMFVAYTIYRYWYHPEFQFASSHLIRSAQLGNRSALIRQLAVTALLGTAFMGFKAYEYATDVKEEFVPGPIFQEAYLEAQHALANGEHPPHSPAVDLANKNAGKTVGEPGYVSPERVQLFLCFYYTMTGIHGVHIIVGIGCIVWLIQQALYGKIPPENYSTVEVVSLYWHLVDMIWLFLMPLLYLVGGAPHH